MAKKYIIYMLLVDNEPTYIGITTDGMDARKQHYQDACSANAKTLKRKFQDHPLYDYLRREFADAQGRFDHIEFNRRFKLVPAISTNDWDQALRLRASESRQYSVQFVGDLIE